jgi:hypothetical protein
MIIVERSPYQFTVTHTPFEKERVQEGGASKNRKIHLKKIIPTWEIERFK